jgi:hypothetical protein
MTRLQVELPVELEILVGAAVKRGFLRENPRKAWTDAERKEAARYYLIKLVAEDLKNSGE